MADTFFTGKILPDPDNANDIGRTLNRWRDLYLSRQAILDVAIGTAPMVITSTTLVTNLNADLLDGKNGSSYGNIYKVSFTNTDLAAGILTVTHNLGTQYNLIQIYDNNNKMVLPDEITATSTTVATIDLGAYGTITGTWNVVVIG